MIKPNTDKGKEIISDYDTAVNDDYITAVNGDEEAIK